MVNWMDTTVFAINVHSYRGLFSPNKQEKKYKNGKEARESPFLLV